MRTSIIGLAGILLATAAATPAFAQQDVGDGFTVTGGATIVSDYRFRGFTQSDEDFAVQGTLTVSHDSGFYLGTWGSSIGFANGAEIDVYAGYTKEITPGLTGDIGVTYYVYPNSKLELSANEIVETYASLTGELGPATAKLGLAYSPKQAALVNLVEPGKASAFYVSGDVSVGVPQTPVTVKGHVGYAKSDSFLGGFDGEVIDYSIGATASWKALTFGVSYVNTDEPTDLGWKDSIGADGTVLFSLSASF